MTRRTTESWLEVLAGLSERQLDEAGLAELRRALGQRSNHVVARTARLVARLGAEVLADDLVDAFNRLLERPVDTDPNCVGKTALALALVNLECDSLEVFEAGVRHVQMEPAYGRPVDTAAELRAVCGMGLAAAGHPQAALALARLLADRESAARQGAARALAVVGPLIGLPLVVHKLAAGDPEPVVLGECMATALELEAETALPLVGELLDARDPEVAEEAALALGESRLPAAEGWLVGAFERAGDGRLRAAMIRGLAILRSDSATEQLLRIASDGSLDDAVEVVRILSVSCPRPGVVTRLAEVVEARSDPSVSAAFAELLADSE